MENQLLLKRIEKLEQVNGKVTEDLSMSKFHFRGWDDFDFYIPAPLIVDERGIPACTYSFGKNPDELGKP